MQKLTFETWLEDVFGRDESTYDLYSQRPRFCPDEPPQHLFTEWLTHVYAEPAVLDRFSANQVGLAFDLTLPHIFAEPNLPIEGRRKAFRALPELFCGLFTPRCSPGLGHQNEAEPGTHHLNGVCYMWGMSHPFPGPPTGLRMRIALTFCTSVKHAFPLLTLPFKNRLCMVLVRILTIGARNGLRYRS